MASSQASRLVLEAALLEAALRRARILRAALPGARRRFI
jgi:hypothetical protein